jgi:hypothetical protein
MTTHGATSLCNAAIELKLAGVGSHWNAQMNLARFCSHFRAQSRNARDKRAARVRAAPAYQSMVLLEHGYQVVNPFREVNSHLHRKIAKIDLQFRVVIYRPVVNHHSRPPVL